jgi:hypothetical protein
MRLIPLILASFLLAASGVRAEQGGPANPSPSAAAQSAPVAQNAYPEAQLYNNHSLTGSYHLNYISGARGGGQIIYDGNGHFSGYDDCSTFDGTYSVNPEGAGTSASKIRVGGLCWSCPAAIGSFKIHPSGAIEFQNVCKPAHPGMVDQAPRRVIFGTQHKMPDDWRY